MSFVFSILYGYGYLFKIYKNILDFIHPDSLDYAKSILNTGFSGSSRAPHTVYVYLGIIG